MHAIIDSLVWVTLHLRVQDLDQQMVQHVDLKTVKNNMKKPVC